MTPMIDMVFLLLVFFMTVSTLAQSGRALEVDLAESAVSKIPDEHAGRGILSIDADGRIFHGVVAKEPEAVKRLVAQSLARNPDLRIQLRADRNTPFGAIRTVLRDCAEAGAFEIIYSTYEER